MHPPGRTALIGPFTFTLLELLIVLVIIGILATLLIPVNGHLRERAQKVQCIANLHSLYVATEAYVQRNGSWPQIFLKNYGAPEDYANAWVAALSPFGIERKSWICPTIQERLHNPDYNDPASAWLDYVSTGFDDKPTSPPPVAAPALVHRDRPTCTATATSSSSPTAVSRRAGI